MSKDELVFITATLILGILAILSGCSARTEGRLTAVEGVVEHAEHFDKGTSHERIEVTFNDGRVIDLRVRWGQNREFRAGRDHRIVYDDEGYLVTMEETGK